MSSIRAVLTYTLLLTFFSPSLSIETPIQNDQRKESKVDLDTFQKLLNQADPPSLHAALHDFSPKKFKHGMFPEDRTAVEAIHKEEPGVATGILKMANLVKRQSNGTVPTTTPAQQSPEPATTQVAPVPLGGESSTTSGSETASPSTTASTSPSDTGSITSAASTTSSSSPSLTAGEVVTTTNSVGLTVISTVGGGATTLSSSGSSTSSTHARSSMTSTLVHTSTLPNGQQSTITAITVVGGSDQGVDTPTGTAGAGSTGTGSGQPSLQTGEAVMTRGCGMEMAVVFGAAVGVAFML